jgi:DUF971 family protein
MKIDWTGGHHSDYPVEYLRDECPCASCTGAHGAPPERTGHVQASANPFQMYKPTLKMVSVEEVGSYALRIHWNDGHDAGIYSYEYLRQICRCSECSATRRGAAP